MRFIVMEKTIQQQRLMIPNNNLMTIAKTMAKIFYEMNGTHQF